MTMARAARATDAAGVVPASPRRATSPAPRGPLRIAATPLRNRAMMRVMTEEMAASEATEAELLARFATGEQEAARLLTARLAPRIHALARRMLDDPAEADDVTQEAMLRLWRIAPDWRDEGAAVGSWLYRVAANLCIDRLRRRREYPMAEPPDRPDTGAGVVAGMETADRARALRRALNTLPERQRVAVVLRHLEDRSNPEIAAILETSIEAVESLLARARRSLATELAPRRAEIGLAE